MNRRRTASNGFIVSFFSSTSCLFVLALVVCGAVLLLTPDALSADPDGYRAVAENLVAYGTFGSHENPTAWRPPLYPCVLAGCLLAGPWSRGAVALVHLALGLGTVWITYRLGKAWGLDRLAWVAAALVGCDPILLAASTQIMTETLAALLAAAALACLTRATETRSTSAIMAAGASVGLAILCRPTFLLWALCLAVVLLLMGRQWLRSGLSRFREGEPRPPGMMQGHWLWFVVAVAVVLAPWAVRNQIRFGQPIVTTTHGGYTFLLANNPFFYEYLRTAPWGTVWEGKELDRAWLAKAPPDALADEIRADRMAYAEALATIRNEPGMFLYACLVRVGRLFALMPHQVSPHEGAAKRLARYAVGIWYLVEFLLVLGGISAAAAAGLARRRPSAVLPYPISGWLFSVLLVGSFAVAHSIYWTDMRMRAPLVPVLGLAAAAGLGSIAGWMNRRKSFGHNCLSM
jgi:4-amino-4-deoxy-L-arabinose transferase-like glycosyltransferase